MSAATLRRSLGELGHELAEDNLELGRFSDAEIAAVTPFLARENRLVPLPTLDVLEEAQRHEAIRAAKQSLIERGLFLDGEPGEVTNELATILEFSTNPSAVVIIDHMSREHDDYSTYLYGIGSAGHLCELSGEDSHEFVVRSTPALTDVLLAIVDPLSEAEATDGPQLERTGEAVPPGWETLEAALEVAHTMTRLSMSRKIAPDIVEDSTVSFAAGAGGVWGTSGRSDERGTAMYARSLSRASTRDALAALLGAGDTAVSLD